MKSNHNLAPSNKNKALALVGALTLAASVGTAEASTIKAHKTPQEALVGLVTKLEQGKSVRVTAEDVTVDGPILDAKSQPVVFKDGKQTYIAYRQDSQPDFNVTPQMTVSNMVIAEATPDQTAHLTEAHLNKDNQLVDTQGMGVGYSFDGE